MLSQVVELIEAKRKFAITSHVRPDGDSLGSSLGLYWLLRALDKDVEVIMRDPVPHAYQQLPGAKDVSVTPAADSPTTQCSSSSAPTSRARACWILKSSSSSTSTTTPPPRCLARSTGSIRPPPPCGEMIYNLCKATGVRVTKEIAECVYTALITDTGSFHFSNTTERTFKVASELLRTGVKPAKTAEAVFASYPWSTNSIDGRGAFNRPP